MHAIGESAQDRCLPASDSLLVTVAPCYRIRLETGAATETLSMRRGRPGSCRLVSMFLWTLLCYSVSSYEPVAGCPRCASRSWNAIAWTGLLRWPRPQSWSTLRPRFRAHESE